MLEVTASSPLAAVRPRERRGRKTASSHDRTVLQRTPLASRTRLPEGSSHRSVSQSPPEGRARHGSKRRPASRHSFGMCTRKLTADLHRSHRQHCGPRGGPFGQHSAGISPRQRDVAERAALRPGSYTSLWSTIGSRKRHTQDDHRTPLTSLSPSSTRRADALRRARSRGTNHRYPAHGRRFQPKSGHRPRRRQSGGEPGQRPETRPIRPTRQLSRTRAARTTRRGKPSATRCHLAAAEWPKGQSDYPARIRAQIDQYACFSTVPSSGCWRNRWSRWRTV